MIQRHNPEAHPVTVVVTTVTCSVVFHKQEVMQYVPTGGYV